MVTSDQLTTNINKLTEPCTCKKLFNDQCRSLGDCSSCIPTQQPVNELLDQQRPPERMLHSGLFYILRIRRYLKRLKGFTPLFGFSAFLQKVPGMDGIAGQKRILSMKRYWDLVLMTLSKSHIQESVRYTTRSTVPISITTFNQC